MTETAETPVSPEGPESSGHPDVDAALDAVGALEERPVPEHLAAYETAHVLLRQALSEAPTGSPAQTPSETLADPDGAVPGDVDAASATVPADADQPVG